MALRQNSDTLDLAATATRLSGLTPTLTTAPPALRRGARYPLASDQGFQHRHTGDQQKHASDTDTAQAQVARCQSAHAAGTSTPVHVLVPAASHPLRDGTGTSMRDQTAI